MEECKKKFEESFPDFINNSTMWIVWEAAWKESRKIALEDCRQRVRKLYESND